MRTLLKNINKVGLYALGLMALTLISWKAVESRATFVWYEVEDNGSGDTNKKIGEEYPNGEPGFECQDNSGEMCAVQIDKKDYTGPINNLEHAYQLEALGLISVGTPSYRNL